MNKPLTAQHSEWLSLVEVSGPFLTLPVLKRALPMGLDPTPLPLVDDLRVAWKEVGDDESLTPRWIRWVLSDLLELPDEVLKEGTAIGPAFTYTVPEHSVRLRPDFIVVDPDASSDAPARLLVTLLPAGTELDERLPDSKWSADAVDRMAELCRGARVRLGLVTNGDQWALVDAPLAGPTGVATWDANLWLEERITLDAFTTLLGVRRFFSVAPEDTLEAMLAESANAEAEVTDQLGKQVRQAVELLVDAMSRANRDRGGHLFDDLTAEQVYEAAVTVMMRLVFLLSAEERGLFLLGDETYDSTYAVSTLRGQLQEEANTYGEEVIARRTDAWHRLLATFRMVYGGAQHENLRLPAYGGSLFDPDRFPILEGRKADESWRSSPSHPLPIDNRTVLHILGALQVLTFKDRRGVKEARRLSFRALDVEQIGHVYEGLLDHSAVRVDEVAIGLRGNKDPEVALALIEAESEAGRNRLVQYLAELAGLSAKAVEKALDVEPDPADLERLTSACDNDHALADRIAPYLGLMRSDLADLPTVFLPGSMYVTQSSDRRSSGTYYTPRALAEEVVLHALEPLVYAPGPAEGVPPAPENLKTSGRILALKVCDMAMGSGAFLVATCRYLSARLLEAWQAEGLGTGDAVAIAGGGTAVMPADEGDREILARRLVADSCLYGVDRNPMAVEMAKLSMWLITLAKDRPFTFVDHALRCGDSLLGVTDLRQLDCLHLLPEVGRQLHGGSLFDPSTRIAPLVRQALGKRQQLESFPVLDVHDADRKSRLLAEADALLDEMKVIGNVIIGAAVATSTAGTDAYAGQLLSVAPEVASALDPERSTLDRLHRIDDLRMTAAYWLDQGRPFGEPERVPFHWPLEFPEVFLDGEHAGFDAIVGNPPFLGSTKIGPAFGATYREYLHRYLGDGVAARADLVVSFLLRAAQLVSAFSAIALIATRTVAQGGARRVGLDSMISGGFTLVRARSSLTWPGEATLTVALIWLMKGSSGAQPVLDGERVAAITGGLDAESRVTWRQQRLRDQPVRASQGVMILGAGFLLDSDEAHSILAADSHYEEVIKPYANGEDLNQRPDSSGSRYVIDFGTRDLTACAEYPICLEIVRERVKPGRDGNKHPERRAKWWQFGGRAQAIRDSTRDLENVIVLAKVSKTVSPVLVPNRSVFADKVIIFSSDRFDHYGLLLSSFHYWWAIETCATLRDDLSYSPQDCLDTLVFPPSWGEIADAAYELHRYRTALVIERDIGLTSLYNAVHDQADQSAEISMMRDHHCALDLAVRDAYGWWDLDLDYGFHETRQGERFTLGRDVRAEVIDRLLELNKRLWESQQSGVDVPPTRRARSIAPPSQLRLGEA